MTGRTSAVPAGDRREAATLTTEHRIVRPDGEVRWLQAKAHVSFAPDGSPVGEFGVVVDITDRRKTERDRDAAVAARERPFAGRGAVERRIALLSQAADLLDAPFDLDGAAAGGLPRHRGDRRLVHRGPADRRGIHHAAVAHRDPAMVARARQVKEQLGCRRADLPPHHHQPGAAVRRGLRRPAHRRHRPGPRVPPDPARFQMSSFLVVPLIAGGKGIGIITLVGCRPAHRPRRREPRRRPRPPCRGRRREDPPLRAANEDNLVLQSSLLPANLPDIPASPCRTTDPAPRASGSAATSTTCSTGRGRWWVVLGDVWARARPRQPSPRPSATPCARWPLTPTTQPPSSAG